MQVQSMAWGFLVSAVTVPLYIGVLREQLGSEILPLMSWVLLAISVIFGQIITAFSMRHEVTVNIIFSALFGVYAGLLIVASLGYKFTEGLSAGDIMSGKGGCTTTSCYITLGVTSFVALLSLYNQILIKKFVDGGSIDMPGTLLDFNGASNSEEGGKVQAGCYAASVHYWWCSLKVAADPVFTLNESLVTIGDPECTEDGKKAAVGEFVDSIYKLLTSLGFLVVFMCTITLVISTVELFAMGAYTRTSSMTVLGMLLFGTCLITLITVYFGVHCHHLPKVEGQITGKKKRWSRFFLVLGFLNTPCSGAMSLLCFTLGGKQSMQVPWVSEFIGTQTGLTRDTLLGQYSGGNASSAAAAQYQSQLNETAQQLSQYAGVPGARSAISTQEVVTNCAPRTTTQQQQQRTLCRIQLAQLSSAQLYAWHLLELLTYVCTRARRA
eukprot:COSAG05_NODE_2234_length_3350_cov_2.022093_2_plen_439_part_00